MPDAMNLLKKLAILEREKLVRKAMTSGSVSKEEFDGLDRLEKLSDGDRSWHQWWIPACAFLLPLSVVTLLYMTEQRETEVYLDTTA